MIGLFIDEHYYEIISVIPAVMLLAGMLFSVKIDPYIQDRDRKIMYIIGALVFSLIVENYFDYLLQSAPGMFMVRRIVDIYGYSIRPVILLLFLYIVDPERDHKT